MSSGLEGLPKSSCTGGLVIAACLLASPARLADPAERAETVDAQTLPSDAARRAAEAHFARGLALAKVPHGWAGALGEFLESRRLYPTPSATRNAAIASRVLGRYTDALELYDSLLSDFADSMSSA